MFECSLPCYYDSRVSSLVEVQRYFCFVADIAAAAAAATAAVVIVVLLLTLRFSIYCSCSNLMIQIATCKPDSDLISTLRIKQITQTYFRRDY